MIQSSMNSTCAWCGVAEPLSLLSNSSIIVPSGVMIMPSLLTARSASNSVPFSRGDALAGYLPQGIGSPNRSRNFVQASTPLRLKYTGQYSCRPRPSPYGLSSSAFTRCTMNLRAGTGTPRCMSLRVSSRSSGAWSLSCAYTKRRCERRTTRAGITICRVVPSCVMSFSVHTTSAGCQPTSSASIRPLHSWSKLKPPSTSSSSAASRVP